MANPILDYKNTVMGFFSCNVKDETRSVSATRPELSNNKDGKVDNSKNGIKSEQQSGSLSSALITNNKHQNNASRNYVNSSPELQNSENNQMELNINKVPYDESKPHDPEGQGSRLTHLGARPKSSSLSSEKTPTLPFSSEMSSSETFSRRKHSKLASYTRKPSGESLSACKQSTEMFSGRKQESLSSCELPGGAFCVNNNSQETLTGSKHSTEALYLSKPSGETLSASKNSTETLAGSKHSTQTVFGNKSETLSEINNSSESLAASKQSAYTLSERKPSGETLSTSKQSVKTWAASTKSEGTKSTNETFSGSTQPRGTNPTTTKDSTDHETFSSSQQPTKTSNSSKPQSTSTMPTAICPTETQSACSNSSSEICPISKEADNDTVSPGSIIPVTDKSMAATSGNDGKPMALAIPTKEQLLNALGGGFGNFKANTSANDDTLEIGKIFILKNKVLGQGPSSIVYEGRLESLKGMPVAVKRITCKNKYMAARTHSDMNEIWKKLDREVDLLRGMEQWRHPHIVGYYQSQTVLNELYIAFQLCQGDLEDYVNEEFRFWRENISPLEINQNMAEGIQFLHANSIVHRDLKPKNVFLVWQQGKCRAVIGDFGMSKVTDRGLYSLSLSVGSVGYLAPEVWEEASKAVRRNNRERPKIENKSDIFPLGLLFFFTITNGEHAFGDELLGSQLQIAAGRQPHFHHSRPEEFTFELLLRKMFSRNPSLRPTAEEVCNHPALWDNDTVLQFLDKCSDHIQKMANEGKNVDDLVPNTLLPHGNWMRELPDALRQYLKRYRDKGTRKLLYQGKESSTRYFLRAIRNIDIHFDDIPDDVKKVFTVHQAVFWLSRCPRLLIHLFKNIERTGFSFPKRDKSFAPVPPKKPTPKRKSSSKSLVKKQAGPGSSHQGSREKPSSQYKGKGTYTTETILLPPSWVPMHVNEPNRIVVLQKNTAEYRQVADKFLHQAKSGAYAHKMEYETNKLKIAQIERIQNKRLYQQFKVQHNQISDEKGESLEDCPMVRQLWHGTTPESIPNIIKHGFNRGYSGKNGTWYGDGVYFAVDASYAARAWLTQCIPEENGEGHVFLADVITGNYCQGHYGMRYLPPIDPEEPTVLYDSAADQPDSPMEFVIFHDTQAYPSYHITFTTL